MMFEQNFMPEGAEINPDTPRKKGLARLFEILSRDLDGIFLSGALAMLVCVPAAILAGIALWLGSLPLCLLAAVAAGWLVGPALTGLYDTILRALRDEPGFWWHTYKRAWKQNFRSSLVPGIVFTVLWALLAWSAFVLPQITEISLNALFYGSIFQKSSNCIRMFFGFLPQTALSAIVQVGYWLLIAFLIPRCAFMFLLTGLWVPSLLAAFSVYSTMEKNLHLEERIQDIKNY